ncbi:hypothetical protein QX249_11105 [Vibrio parahaemolyticus]|uniref:Uncharacterized protein n=1 Tax=Vibrio parahaemolyticus TaxID=670 RepID=A0AAW8Q077_VIBPH|nr:hypothetical protein [Vibrio parahaemolyticus]MDS1821211.1 hypothetical protein [Vibrio parahaemolyticus]
MITKKLKDAILNCKYHHGTLFGLVFPCREIITKKNKSVDVWTIRVGSKKFSPKSYNAGSYRTVSAYQTESEDKFKKMIQLLTEEYGSNILQFDAFDEFECKSVDKSLFNFLCNKN